MDTRLFATDRCKPKIGYDKSIAIANLEKPLNRY